MSFAYRIMDSPTPTQVPKKKKKLKKWIFRLFLLLLVGAGIWFFLGREEPPVVYITEEVKVDDVREVVEVSGTTESALTTDLRFRTSGSVSNIFVQVGNTVKKGDLLAQLEDSSQRADVARASASVAAAQAELRKRYAGPTREEDRISKTKIEEAELVLRHALEEEREAAERGNQRIALTTQEVENAEISLRNALESGENTNEQSSTALDNALENADKTISVSIDDLRSTLATADSILGVSSEKQNEEQAYIGFYTLAEKNTAKNDYRRNAALFSALENEYFSAGSLSAEQAKTLLQKTEEELVNNRNLMSTLYTLLENSATGQQLAETEVDAYQSTVETRQSAISTELGTVRSVQQAITGAELNLSGTGISTGSTIDSAKNALALAKENLASVRIDVQNTNAARERDVESKKLRLKQAKEDYIRITATPRPVDVASYEATVAERRASLLQAQSRLNDTRIVAPVDGVITDIGPELGESVSSPDRIVSIMTKGLQIVANVPETDIPKVEPEARVELTFDAFDLTEIFMGRVTMVDPAETIVEGVVYYETTVQLDIADDERIRSGMTADMEILSGRNPEAVSIPPEAVRYEDGKPFVFVLRNGEKEQVFIKIGLEGEDATEVLEGVEIGERVVLAEES